MSFGKFVGEVVTRWEKDPKRKDRTMTLLEDFKYIDPDGNTWLASKSKRIDGTSIPSFFWGYWIGAPYVGDFRRASVVHDIACQEMQKPHKAVHRMFYNAMSCDGVPKLNAMFMYAAVRIGGPRWKASQPVAIQLLAPQDIKDIEEEIAGKGLSMKIGDLELFLDQMLDD